MGKLEDFSNGVAKFGFNPNNKLLRHDIPLYFIALPKAGDFRMTIYFEETPSPKSSIFSKVHKFSKIYVLKGFWTLRNGEKRFASLLGLL